MSIALANETLFPRAAFFALGPADPRMEPGAPAAAEPHTLVLLSEVGEGIPRRGIKRPDRILAHCTLHSPALVRLTSERVYARPAWHGQRSRISLSNELVGLRLGDGSRDLTCPDLPVRFRSRAGEEEPLLRCEVGCPLEPDGVPEAQVRAERVAHRVDEPVGAARREAVLPPDVEHLHAGVGPLVHPTIGSATSKEIAVGAAISGCGGGTITPPAPGPTSDTGRREG